MTSSNGFLGMLKKSTWQNFFWVHWSTTKPEEDMNHVAGSCFFLLQDDVLWALFVLPAQGFQELGQHVHLPMVFFFFFFFLYGSILVDPQDPQLCIFFINQQPQSWAILLLWNSQAEGLGNTMDLADLEAGVGLVTHRGGHPQELFFFSSYFFNVLFLSLCDDYALLVYFGISIYIYIYINLYKKPEMRTSAIQTGAPFVRRNAWTLWSGRPEDPRIAVSSLDLNIAAKTQSRQYSLFDIIRFSFLILSQLSTVWYFQNLAEMCMSSVDVVRDGRRQRKVRTLVHKIRMTLWLGSFSIRYWWILMDTDGYCP